MLASWFRSFLPAAQTVRWKERLRAALCAFVGLLFTYLIGKQALGASSDLPYLIAPMGASSILVFCVPASPMAQPWPVLGGNVISALIAVACLHTIHDPALAAAIAVALSICAMFALRCLHPPSGAVALTTVLGGHAVATAGYSFALMPVGLNSLVLVCLGLLLNSASGRRYPHAQHALVGNQHGTKDSPPSERMGISQADLDAVFERYGQVVDMSRDDFESLVAQAEMQAYRRRFGGIRCRDIMTHDVVFVEYGTPLQEAWSMMRAHNIWALPVVSAAHKVIGLIGREDFMQDECFDQVDGIGRHLRAFLMPSITVHSERSEVVGQLMRPTIVTLAADRPYIELVPLMTDTGQRHIPIIDLDERLAGLVSQSDLIAALYGSGLTTALNLDSP